MELRALHGRKKTVLFKTKEEATEREGRPVWRAVTVARFENIDETPVSFLSQEMAELFWDWLIETKDRIGDNGSVILTSESHTTIGGALAKKMGFNFDALLSQEHGAYPVCWMKGKRTVDDATRNRRGQEILARQGLIEPGVPDQKMIGDAMADDYEILQDELNAAAWEDAMDVDPDPKVYDDLDSLLEELENEKDKREREDDDG